MITAHELTELQFANSGGNGRIGVHVLILNRTPTVLVLLQPVNAKYAHANRESGF